MPRCLRLAKLLCGSPVRAHNAALWDPARQHRLCIPTHCAFWRWAVWESVSPPNPSKHWEILSMFMSLVAVRVKVRMDPCQIYKKTQPAKCFWFSYPQNPCNPPHLSLQPTSTRPPKLHEVARIQKAALNTQLDIDTWCSSLSASTYTQNHLYTWVNPCGVDPSATPPFGFGVLEGDSKVHQLIELPVPPTGNSPDGHGASQGRAWGFGPGMAMGHQHGHGAKCQSDWSLFNSKWICVS